MVIFNSYVSLPEGNDHYYLPIMTLMQPEPGEAPEALPPAGVGSVGGHGPPGTQQGTNPNR